MIFFSAGGMCWPLFHMLIFAHQQRAMRAPPRSALKPSSQRRSQILFMVYCQPITEAHIPRQHFLPGRFLFCAFYQYSRAGLLNVLISVML